MLDFESSSGEKRNIATGSDEIIAAPVEEIQRIRRSQNDAKDSLLGDRLYRNNFYWNILDEDLAKLTYTQFDEVVVLGDL